MWWGVGGGRGAYRGVVVAEKLRLRLAKLVGKLVGPGVLPEREEPLDVALLARQQLKVNSPQREDRRHKVAVCVKKENRLILTKRAV